MNPYLPTASFPVIVWNGTSYNKINVHDDIDPGFRDHNRISSEVIAIQDYLLNLAYGEIYAKDNTVDTVLNSAGKTQITIFSANGFSNKLTPDYTNDHILVPKEAEFLVTVSVALKNTSGSGHEISAGLFKNNGTSQFNNVHGHRTLAAGTDLGSITLNGIIRPSAGDTIELWAITNSGSDRSVDFEDVTLTMVQIGT